jgi:hypothetical protein
VLPLAPLLAAGPPPVLAAYLGSAAADPAALPCILTGRLTLQLVGVGAALPRVRLQALAGPALRLRAARLAGFATLQLELETSAPAVSPATAFGRTLVTLEVHGQTFPLEVQAFRPPPTAEHVTLHLEDGGEPRDGTLWLERGGRRVRSRLVYTSPEGVPVQWQHLECRHPAVRVEVPAEGIAAARAEALVTWDPALVRPDGEEVPFQLRLRGLPRWVHRQLVCATAPPLRQHDQRLDVRPEALERQWDGPLLIDPGPPRIVLGYWDRSRREVIYPERGGDAGLEPEELGLAPDEYAAAVHGRGLALPLLRSLVAAARARCCAGLPDTAEVWLCGRPWVPPRPELAGVEVYHWRRVGLAAGEPHLSLPPDTPVMSLEAWECRVAAERLPIPTLGVAIVQSLSGASDAGEITSEPPGWLQLACESVFVDYSWGADYAWRRLQQTCARHLAALRVSSQADEQLKRAAVEAFTVLLQFLEPLAQGGAAQLVLSPLFGNREVVKLAQTVAAGCGRRVIWRAPQWLTGLARLAAEAIDEIH